MIIVSRKNSGLQSKPVVFLFLFAVNFMILCRMTILNGLVVFAIDREPKVSTNLQHPPVIKKNNFRLKPNIEER
jgi:hypothetical protein